MMKKIWMAVLGVVAITGVAQAQTAYVSDVLYITMRTGQGDSFRILKTLKTSTKMEILEKSEDEKYARVRTEDGEEGWVQFRFLITERTNELKFEAAQAKLERLQQENAQLKEKYNKTRSELKSTEKERKELDSKASKLEKETARMEQVAAKPIQLDRENKDLRTRNAELNSEVQQLKKEVDQLSGASDRDWFLTGAGVVLLGVIIGLVVPRLRLRKTSSWA